MKPMTACLAILPLTLAAACTSTGTITSGANTPPPPANYRAAVATYVKQNFIDPYSIRGGQISQPIYKASVDLLDPSPAWTVCVRANAKNRMGGYTGAQDTLIRFRGNVPVSALDAVQTMCADAVYSPFPEIEGG